MKKNLAKLISVCLAVALLLLVSLKFVTGAHADTAAHVRIEGSSTTYADKAVSVSGCTVTDTAGAPHTLGPVALCAVKSALDEAGVGMEIQDFGFGLFIKKIGIDIKTSHIAQKLAELPQKQFEQVITEVFY